MLDTTVKANEEIRHQSPELHKSNTFIKGRETTFTYIKSRNRQKTGGQRTENERKDKELNTKLHTARNTKP